MEMTLYELIKDNLAEDALCIIVDNDTQKVITAVIRNHKTVGLNNLDIETAERIVVSHTVRPDERFTDVEVNFIYVK